MFKRYLTGSPFKRTGRISGPIVHYVTHLQVICLVLECSCTGT